MRGRVILDHLEGSLVPRVFNMQRRAEEESGSDVR